MARNDGNIITVQNPGTIDDGAGDDRYILSNNTVQAGAEITILDAEGINTIQLIDGLDIASSSVAADAVQLSLTNGAVITILQASGFTFEVGGNPLLGVDGTNQTFAEFTTTTLGVADGDTAGGAVTIGAGTTGDPTFALAADATGVNEGDTANFTLTTENVADGTEVAYTVSGVDAADLASGSLTGTAIVNGNTATIAIDVAADELTEGEETMTVSIDGQTTTASMTVNDTSTDGTATLTSGIDVATANIFNAPRDFTPGGTDQVNSLDDDDVLTGEGDNPTLNWSAVNDADTGDLNIQPTLNGIETINVNVRNDGNSTLDLQDATGVLNVNVNGLDDFSTFTADNMQSAENVDLSINDSNADNGAVDFLFEGGALAGNSDAVDLTLNDVALIRVRAEDEDGFGGAALETLNIASTGDSNSVGVIGVEGAQTINISGDQALNLGASANVSPVGNPLIEAQSIASSFANVAGSLTTIDASALTASLSLAIGTEINATLDGTSGTNVSLSVTGTAADDSFTMTVGTTVDTNDTINGGEGADTLTLLGNTTVAEGSASNINSIESLHVLTGHDADAVADVVTVDADAFDSLASITVRNEGMDGFNSQAEAATINLNDLTSAQATAITALHGTTGNNAVTSTVVDVNLKDTSGTSDTVAVTLSDAQNTDPRFNITVDADNVENITLTDSDTESNSVLLNSVANHTGTVTLTGGEAGDFMNLDVTANGMGKDLTGGSTDATGWVDPAAGAAERINAATIDASAYTGDAIVRVGTNDASATGAQTITMGSGNDTVIFDNLNFNGIADGTAGLSIADTVTGGTGSDTLVVDGNGTQITLGASEWVNVSGFDSLRLVGNGSAPTANPMGVNYAPLEGDNSYNVTLTNELIDSTDSGSTIAIINDNDQDNDDANDADGAFAAESGVTINARALTATNNFSYDGEEGATQTVDRFVLEDANMNSSIVIDGGAVDNNTTNNSGPNNDVLEVVNSAEVTTGDLANIKNVSSINVTNDSTVAQSSLVQLDDTTVDMMVDSYQASNSTTNVERLFIDVEDNINDVTGLTTSTTGLDLQAASLTTKSGVDAILGRGENTVTTGAANDFVVLLGNYSTGTYANSTLDERANNAAGNRAITDNINLGESSGDNDLLITIGAVDLSGATLVGLDSAVVSLSDVVMTTSQVNQFGIDFVGGVVDDFRGPNDDRLDFLTESTTAHTLTIIDDGAVLNLDQINLDSSAAQNLTVTATDAAGNQINTLQTTGQVNDDSGTGVITVNVSATSNPNFSVADVTVDEGVGTAAVTITRDDATDLATIDVATADGTATDGTDYTALTETVTFAAGATTATVNVAIIDDADTEGDETFTVNLSNASIGNITDAEATVAITDNEGNFVTFGVGTAAADVTGDNAVDETFIFDLEAARATADNTQVNVTQFDTANDTLRVDLATADAALTTLNQLNGVDGISVTPNVITNNTLINFGPDANGDVITLTLAGLTDPTAIGIEVV